MRRMRNWLPALASLLLLAACGDGSVRSPGVVGPGELVEMRVLCLRGPVGGETLPCTDDPARIAVPQTAGSASDVVFRVEGRYEDGSWRDITDADFIRLSSSDDAMVSVHDGAPTSQREKGRLTARAAGSGGAAVSATITARDTRGQVADAQRRVEVFGRAAVSLAILAVPASEPVAQVSVASGVPQQFEARIHYADGSREITRGGVAWSLSPSGASISGTGVFRHDNPSITDTQRYTLTASLRGAAGISASVEVAVEPAQYVPGSLTLRSQPPVAQIPIGGSLRVLAFARFQIGTESVERDVTQALASLVSSAPQSAAFEPSSDAVPNILRGLRSTSGGAPVTVTAQFQGETASLQVTVLDADVAELRLVPLGVAPFEAAGFFDRPDLDATQREALRAVIADDARRLGLNRDGALPCAGDGCPDGALPAHRVLPGTTLAYAVFTRDQGDSGLQPVPLDQFRDAVACDTGALTVRFDAGGNRVAVHETRIDPASGEAVPARSASGIRIILVEGLREGEASIRARLGREFSGSGGEGRNCRGEAVQDARQTVQVGAGAGRAIVGSRFNIDRNFACVGFANALDFVEHDDVLGRDKLRSSLSFELADASRIVVFANQMPSVRFSTRGGPARGDGLACRTDGPPPVVQISNGASQERGRLRANGVLALGASCALAEFQPSVPPPGFTGSPQARAATVVALPADDDLVRGASSNGEIAQLCDTLAPLLTLPVGELLGGEAGAGLPVELLSALGGVLDPVLNNRVITGPVSNGLRGLLNELSNGLETVFSLPLLRELRSLLGDILCTIGLPTCQSGMSLLPDVLSILEDLLGQVRGLLPAGSEAEVTPVDDPFDD